MIYALDGQAPEIHPTAWIAPGAQLIGKVRVKAGASVWFGAVIRGDNEWIEIGEDSNIQESAVLHTDMGFPLTIGARCTIGHQALLHGCSIGDECLIGMTAAVMNGAIIADGSLVGAGALVTEGKSFAPRSLLMGSPAKHIRDLDDAAVAKITASALRYRENAARFAAGMELVNVAGEIRKG